MARRIQGLPDARNPREWSKWLRTRHSRHASKADHLRHALKLEPALRHLEEMAVIKEWSHKFGVIPPDLSSKRLSNICQQLELKEFSAGSVVFEKGRPVVLAGEYRSNVFGGRIISIEGGGRRRPP